MRVKVRDFDEETLFSHKRISLGSKSIETPAKAIQIGKTRLGKDEVSSAARGVNEIYFQTNAEQLERDRQTFDVGVRRKIRHSLNKSDDGEFNFVFAKLETVDTLDLDNIQYLTDLIYSTSDFLTVPLMPEFLEAIKEEGRGTDSRYFRAYLQNVEQYLDAAMQINNKPILGTLPALPWDFTNKVIDLYLDRGVRAFCFNFNGRTVTAENQLLNMVTPLMRRIAVENLQEDVFFYALNAHRGRRTSGGDHVPARDFMSFGFGFDILGDKHLAGNLPPHLLEEVDAAPSLRIFERNDYVYEEYGYGPDLGSRLPSDTGLDPERIIDYPQSRYRFAALLNGEQQSLEANDLRPVIDDHDVAAHIGTKRGISSDNLEDMKTAKRSFEGQKTQTRLDDLDDLFE